MVELICEFCKRTFPVSPDRKDVARFCSRRCNGDWRKENDSNAGAQLLESCRERDCGGPAYVYSGRRLKDGYQRYHRCGICGAKFKTFAANTHEDKNVFKFDKWLYENVKQPPKDLTALSLFDETLQIWEE